MNKKLPKPVSAECVVKSYANGRENGYCLVRYRRDDEQVFKPVAVMIAQIRTGESIAVWVDRGYTPWWSGNVPSDAATLYDFRPTKQGEEKAARLIVKALCKRSAK